METGDDDVHRSIPAATTARRRSLVHTLVVPAVIVAIGIGVGLAIGLRRPDAGDLVGPSGQVEEVRSHGRDVASLDQLVDDSDLVVIARAAAIQPGRVFGSAPEAPDAPDAPDEPDGAVAIRSQIVELQVSAVLIGDDPGGRLLLEEEATTSDGRRLVVDGLRPTVVGDQGIFFLVEGLDASVPYVVTTTTCGRFLRATTSAGSADDELLGVTAGCSAAAELTALGGRALTDAVLARGRSTGRTGVGVTSSSG